jgi:hypothetical protein
MQRKSVLLPEPELPIIEITSPFCADSETPFSTSSDPKLLCRSFTISAGRASAAMSIALPPPRCRARPRYFATSRATRVSSDGVRGHAGRTSDVPGGDCFPFTLGSGRVPTWN